MAMDTAGERYSAINVGSPWRGLNYIPSGTVDNPERQAVAFLYAGISSVAAPVFSGTIPNISHTENTGTHSYDLSTYFTGATSYSIAPAVEAGWSFDTGTAELIVDTDDVSVFGPYVVTGTNVAGSADSNGFTVTIVAASQGGSAKKKRRKRYFVEIDGQYFEVDSQAEAEERILKRALSLAENVAEKATARNSKRIRRGRKVIAPGVPKIASSPEIAPVVDEYRERINAVYQQIAIDAELRELLRIKLLEEDDDEAITVLLLH